MSPAACPFRLLAQATVILAVALVILGAVVRVTGSGMGCPDWPLCFGQWLPPWEMAAILEWLHRTLAAMVSAASLALLASIVASRERRARLGRPAALLVGALVAQIALGAYTVWQSNAAPSVAWHLVMGYVFLGALLSIARRSVVAEPTAQRDAWAIAPSALAVAAVLVQCFLGGLVAAGFAGRACPDFPTCHGAWLPPLVGPVGLQMGHRYAALAVVLFVAVALSASERRGPGAARTFTRLAAAALAVQVGIGIVAVLGPFDLVVRVLHQIGAVSVFMACWLALDALLEGRPATPGGHRRPRAFSRIWYPG